MTTKEYEMCYLGTVRKVKFALSQALNPQMGRRIVLLLFS